MVTSTRPVGPLVIDIENITKDYVMGEETVHALRGVSLQIHKNEYIAVMGPSGSGKSTLMNMLGCLDTLTCGHYEFNGNNVSRMNDVELAGIRKRAKKSWRCLKICINAGTPSFSSRTSATSLRTRGARCICATV